jgi:hypothetical protein
MISQQGHSFRNGMKHLLRYDVAKTSSKNLSPFKNLKEKNE